VDDGKGEKASRELEILAGNEPPVLTFDILRGNKSFFFPNQSFDYEVKVTDKEDGSLGSGISADQVSVSIDYLPQGFDKTQIAQGHMTADENVQFLKGKTLMEGSDCKSCHLIDKKSIGPMYKDVAKKYKGDPKAVDYLAKKVISGGGGVWGEVNMAAHPQLSVADASEMVKYVLSLDAVKATPTLPSKGSYTTKIEKGTSEGGVYLLRASYADKGANGVPSAKSEQTLLLRSASLAGGSADSYEDIQKFKLPDMPVTLMIGQRNNAYLGFKQIDLTGIDQLTFIASAAKQYGMAGGTVEVRLDSPKGELIGQSSEIVPQEAKGQRPPPSIATAKLKPVSGFHDIYFIYKNEKAAPGQMLYVLLNINFSYNPKSATVAMK
jgi:cytochrome c